MQHDIVIPEINEHPDFEIDRERLRLLFASDEIDMFDFKAKLLSLDPKKFYLDFYET